MNPTVYAEPRRAVELLEELGHGGEGRVFAWPRDRLECAKLYSRSLRTDDVRKLTLMVRDPPRDPAFDERQHRSIAWPRALLFGDRDCGSCVGFLMPRLDTRTFRSALAYLDPDERRRHFGGSFSWRHLCVAALNTASAVGAIHEKGYCIGDLNESNLMVAPNALVTLIDCDSFQVPDPDSGAVYRCLVGKPEYTAPELRGKSFADVDRTPESDRFALGVLLFQFLMEGTHPYQARGPLVDDAPTSEAKIVKGLFPYAGRRSGLAPPKHAPPYDLLTPELQELFERCFQEGHANPGRRPAAADWFRVLDGLVHRLKPCDKNVNHVFSQGRRQCPWCELAAEHGQDPFPAPIGQQIAVHGASSLDSPESRLASLCGYVDMALADGRLSREEEAMLVALGERLQVPRRDVDRLLRQRAPSLGARAALAARPALAPLRAPPPRPSPGLDHYRRSVALVAAAAGAALGVTTSLLDPPDIGPSTARAGVFAALASLLLAAQLVGGAPLGKAMRIKLSLVASLAIVGIAGPWPVVRATIVWTFLYGVLFALLAVPFHALRRVRPRATPLVMIALGTIVAGGVWVPGIFQSGRQTAVPRAAATLQRGCDRGNLTSCNELGLAYEYGKGVPADLVRARSLYQRACDAGSSAGCFNLGYQYAEGRGGLQSHVRAAQLYQQACAKSSPKGCDHLGGAYEHGEGLAEDLPNAAVSYQRACDLKNGKGCTHLARLYAAGKGVAKNGARARELNERGCELGEVQGCLAPSFPEIPEPVLKIPSPPRPSSP